MLGWQDMDEDEKKAYMAELHKERQVRVTVTLKMEGFPLSKFNHFEAFLP